jgi:hypothetical protein
LFGRCICLVSCLYDVSVFSIVPAICSTFIMKDRTELKYQTRRHHPLVLLFLRALLLTVVSLLCIELLSCVYFCYLMCIVLLYVYCCLTYFSRWIAG